MAEQRQHRQQPARWLPVATDRVVSLEHPCIVNNVDSGLKSLGGEHHIKHLLAPAGQRLPVALSLRPDDPLAKKVISREVAVRNVLLRVSLPRRTGRKRKRGSDQPFEFDSDADGDPNGQVQTEYSPRPLNPAELLRRLRDNADKYTIQPVGPINETHRFRALPDFQLRASTQPVMHGVGQGLVDPSIYSVKQFAQALGTTPGSNLDEEVIAPPTFTAFEQSLSYGYRQNAGVSVVRDEQSGKVKTINTQKARKRTVLAVAADVEEVPLCPPAELEPLGEQTVYLKQAVKNLSQLMDERPIVTRRVAYNLIDWGSESLFKDATQYVGFSFRSGPWRDALVRYGVDPRKDPKYRIYQTLSFQLLSKDKLVAAARRLPGGKNQWIRSERHRKDELPTHVFDGKSVTTNGKTWQICDIQEPILRGLLETDRVRTECESETWGWFYNGTMSKVRIIMRDMISLMLNGEEPDLAIYSTIATMPDIIDPISYQGCYFDRDKHPEKVAQLAVDIRTLAKTDLVMRAAKKHLVDDGSPGPWKGEWRQRPMKGTLVDTEEGALEQSDEESDAERDLDASDEDKEHEGEGEGEGETEVGGDSEIGD
ncbi:hypothetical protein MBLNU459_g3133t2 [Dothideomycetes sp. NU459]